MRNVCSHLALVPFIYPPDFNLGMLTNGTEREALWIRFSGDCLLTVKVYVVGINAVLGESKHGSEISKKPDTKTKAKQICLAVPSEQWLDEVVECDRSVEQFVAVPTGCGYSIEAQLTSADKIFWFHFEIRSLRPQPDFSGLTYAGTLMGKTVWLFAHSRLTIWRLKVLIQEKDGVPPHHQLLISEGRRLEDHC